MPLWVLLTRERKPRRHEWRRCTMNRAPRIVELANQSQMTFDTADAEAQQSYGFFRNIPSKL